jgi:hypothetical protein
MTGTYRSAGKMLAKWVAACVGADTLEVPGKTSVDRMTVA